MEPSGLIFWPCSPWRQTPWVLVIAQRKANVALAPIYIRESAAPSYHMTASHSILVVTAIAGHRTHFSYVPETIRQRVFAWRHRTIRACFLSTLSLMTNFTSHCPVWKEGRCCSSTRVSQGLHSGHIHLSTEPGRIWPEVCTSKGMQEVKSTNVR